MKPSRERWGGHRTCTRRTTSQGARTPGRIARACRGGGRRLPGRRHRCRRAPSLLSPPSCRRTVHRRPSQSPLRRCCRHPPPPDFADPFVGGKLRCFPPSTLIIACWHATVDALDAGHFRCQSSSTAATAATAAAAAAAGPPPPPPPPPWSNSPSWIYEERDSSSTTTSIPAADNLALLKTA